MREVMSQEQEAFYCQGRHVLSGRNAILIESKVQQQYMHDN